MQSNRRNAAIALQKSQLRAQLLRRAASKKRAELRNKRSLILAARMNSSMRTVDEFCCSSAEKRHASIAVSNRAFGIQ